MMPWLLKYEGYPSGVIVAVLLHALLIYIVMPNKFNPENLVKIEQPSYVSATITTDNPQKTRQLQELQRRQELAARERRTREAAKAAEEAQKREQAQRLDAAKKEEQRKLDAESLAKKQREQTAAKEKEQKEQQAAKTAKETEAKQETARRETEAKQEAATREAERAKQVAQEQAAKDAAAKEAANQAQAAAQSEALSAENQLIAQYTAIIREIVSNNWIQPPNTRNGMQVLINIRLVPTGEIVSSVVVQSSGDAVFDRSALQAVEKAGNFPELRDLPNAVFERNFRNFTLMFSPEDLLR